MKEVFVLMCMSIIFIIFKNATCCIFMKKSFRLSSRICGQIDEVDFGICNFFFHLTKVMKFIA